MKRFLSSVLAICIIAALVPFRFTVNAGTDGYYTYMVNDGGAVITSVDWSISGNVTVPDTLGGYPVTSIYDTAFYGCDVVEVKIPDTVTHIGNMAFWACTELEKIEIPNSVKTIGGEAFRSCQSLESITFPDSVISIGNAVLADCISLAEIKVEQGNTKYHSDGNCLIETAGKTLVSGCKNSVIPSDNSVTDIGENAFENCSGLTSIVIPNGVTTIESYAFNGCKNLTSISISESVTYISNGIVKSCKKLESITVDEDNPVYHSDGNCLIETESKTLVAGCKNSVIPADNSVTAIGDCAFDMSGIESVSIPDGVTHIGTLAFYYCASLSEITLPDSVVYIGSNAFDNTLWYHDEENWENEILYIGNHLIEASYTLSGDCRIKDGTKTIAEGAFQYCDGITGVVIPASVISINEYAFEYCTELTDVKFENTKGWSVYHWSTGDTALASSELQNAETAAQYLTDTYSDASWTREEAGLADLNGDGEADASDAIYLLYHVFFPTNENYALNGSGDFNSDSSVDAEDAIYLLYSIFFGETKYPLFPERHDDGWTDNY